MKMCDEKMKDRILGCLIGGAAGDALGYEVEFYGEKEIEKYFGAQGIRRYALHCGIAEISDDTQMTLYTANGLLCGAAAKTDEDGYREYIRRCYLDWLKAQRTYEGTSVGKISWLNALKEMNSRRAPGGTCLNALECGGTGTIDDPINLSKGCGGVMRTAPVGLLFEDEGVCQRLGAAAAAITHGHELGYLPAAMLSGIVCVLMNHPEMSVREAVKRSQEAMKREFAGRGCVQTMSDLIDYALQLTKENMKDVDAIHILGGGWVGEEALAIAVYCAVKYEDDFERCLVAAVNHRGDSDSTGAIAGNILGAKLGLSAIPTYYRENLELSAVIESMADELFEARRQLGGEESAYRWQERYSVSEDAVQEECRQKAPQEKNGEVKSIFEDIFSRLFKNEK